MAGIRSKNTRPEIMIRKALFKKGFRYRLHSEALPGKPDLVLPKYRAVIFVNGCFWHGHDCHMFRLPRTRTEFWAAKILRNQQRDIAVRQQLQQAKWRSLTIWECAVRGRGNLGLDQVTFETSAWLLGSAANLEIRGKSHGHS